MIHSPGFDLAIKRPPPQGALWRREGARLFGSVRCASGSDAQSQLPAAGLWRSWWFLPGSVWRFVFVEAARSLRARRAAEGDAAGLVPPRRHGRGASAAGEVRGPRRARGPPPLAAAASPPAGQPEPGRRGPRLPGRQRLRLPPLVLPPHRPPAPPARPPVRREGGEGGALNRAPARLIEWAGGPRLIGAQRGWLAMQARGLGPKRCRGQKPSLKRNNAPLFLIYPLTLV